MFCPKCKIEYSDGIITCPSCNVALVTQSETDCAIDYVRALFVANVTDAERILNLLKNNQIHCFRRSREAGKYMRLSELSAFGEDIYVARKDYETAMELLNDIDDNREVIEEKACNLNPHIPFYKNPQTMSTIYLIVTITIACAILLISFYRQ